MEDFLKISQIPIQPPKFKLLNPEEFPGQININPETGVIRLRANRDILEKMILKVFTAKGYEIKNFGDNIYSIPYGYGTASILLNINTFIVCFISGSKIYDGELNEKSVEDFQIGDTVMTINGPLPITHIKKSKMTNCSDKISSIFNYKNLTLTGRHSILVDSMIESEYTENISYYDGKQPVLMNKLLQLVCCSNRFTQIIDENEYETYHFVVGDGSKNGIYTPSGIICESMSIDDYRLFTEFNVTNIQEITINPEQYAISV